MRPTRSQRRTRRLTPPPSTTRRPKATRVGNGGKANTSSSSSKKAKKNNAGPIAIVARSSPEKDKDGEQEQQQEKEKKKGKGNEKGMETATPAHKIRAHLTGYKSSQKGSLKLSLERLGVTVRLCTYVDVH